MSEGKTEPIVALGQTKWKVVSHVILWQGHNKNASNPYHGPVETLAWNRISPIYF